MSRRGWLQWNVFAEKLVILKVPVSRITSSLMTMELFRWKRTIPVRYALISTSYDVIMTSIWYDDDVIAIFQPGCACPRDRPVFNNGECITRDQCKQAKPPKINKDNVSVSKSPSEITVSILFPHHSLPPKWQQKWFFLATIRSHRSCRWLQYYINWSKRRTNRRFQANSSNWRWLWSPKDFCYFSRIRSRIRISSNSYNRCEG